MKLYCSYAFTGEDIEVVMERMKRVVKALGKAGHEPYCPLFDPHNKKDTKAIFDYAFEKVTKNDGIVAIVASDRKSEGQLMEIGATLVAKKPLYLLLHESATDMPSHLPKLATITFVWSTQQELDNQLEKL